MVIRYDKKGIENMKTENQYQPTMSGALSPERKCITKREEISHVLALLERLHTQDYIPECLESEFRSAQVFCQRALATPPIQTIIYEVPQQ